MNIHVVSKNMNNHVLPVLWVLPPRTCLAFLFFHFLSNQTSKTIETKTQPSPKHQNISNPKPIESKTQQSPSD